MRTVAGIVTPSAIKVRSTTTTVETTRVIGDMTTAAARVGTGTAGGGPAAFQCFGFGTFDREPSAAEWAAIAGYYGAS